MTLKEYNYTATATVYVTPPVSSSAGDALTADQYASNRTQLYLTLISSPELARAVIDRLKLSQSPDDLTDRIKAKATPLTSLLSITASGTSPTDARNLATAYAETLPSFAKSIEGSGGLRGAPSVVTVALPIAKDPTFVQRWGLLIALTVGTALLGFLYSFAYRRRFPNVRTPDQLRRELHVALAEQVDLKNPEPQLRRLQAELLTGPKDDGSLMIVGARSRDQAKTFSEMLMQSIADRGSVLSDGILIVDVPALLESGASAAALHRADCEQALLVTRYDATSMRDVRQVRDLLTMNNVILRGGIILRRSAVPSRRRPGKPERRANRDEELELPWPTIDVLEAEKHGRTVRAD